MAASLLPLILLTSALTCADAVIVLICLIRAYEVRHDCVMCASKLMSCVMMKPRFLAEGAKGIEEQPTWRESGLVEDEKEVLE